MTVATAHLTELDLAALRGVIEPWTTALLERDWDAALSLCTDDIVFLPPGAPKVTGPDAARAFLEAFPVIRTFVWDIDEIQGREDFATLRGWFDMTVEGEAGDERILGKYVDIFHKEEDGGWRFGTIIWNRDEEL